MNKILRIKNSDDKEMLRKAVEKLAGQFALPLQTQVKDAFCLTDEEKYEEAAGPMGQYRPFYYASYGDCLQKIGKNYLRTERIYKEMHLFRHEICAGMCRNKQQEK